MSDIAIYVDKLGKRYKIGQKEPYKTFRDTISNVASFPIKLIRGRINSDNQDGSGEFWALKDVSFEIKQGEVVGIIGGNGAGKSTLLKILSRITSPTEGSIELHGRVGSLLEVGTGFHPELTGHENIFLSGSIIGMKKREIEDKLEDIVKFAEIEKFLDTPAKRYSSGMYVRLAFAVAAHLDPEILLVDEVLAVGDASFQKKCLSTMDNIANEGRTVLFVSHNMGAVGRLCHRGFLFDHGKLVFSSSVADVITEYTERVISSNAELYFEPDAKKKIQLRVVHLLNHAGKASSELDRNTPFCVLIEYEVRERVVGAHVSVMLDKVDGTPICHSGDIDVAPGGVIDRSAGLYRSMVEFPGGLLNAGAYQIRIGIAKYGGEVYDYCEAFVFYLVDHGSFATLGAGGQQRPGLLALPLTWNTERITSL